MSAPQSASKQLLSCAKHRGIIVKFDSSLREHCPLCHYESFAKSVCQEFGLLQLRIDTIAKLLEDSSAD
jgi:hypothetical protein